MQSSYLIMALLMLMMQLIRGEDGVRIDLSKRVHGSGKIQVGKKRDHDKVCNKFVKNNRQVELDELVVDRLKRQTCTLTVMPRLVMHQDLCL